MRSVDFSQHLCKVTFVFGKHVMKSISVTWPIPVRTRPSSCCWWVSMNFLIEPSVTLSDLGWRSFRKNPRIRWNTSENVLSKLTRKTSHVCHLSRSRHRMLALFPLPIHASITFYVILEPIVWSTFRSYLTSSVLRYFVDDCLIDVQKWSYLVIHAVKLASAEPS